MCFEYLPTVLTGDVIVLNGTGIILVASISATLLLLILICIATAATAVAIRRRRKKRMIITPPRCGGKWFMNIDASNS